MLGDVGVSLEVIVVRAARPPLERGIHRSLLTTLEHPPHLGHLECDKPCHVLSLTRLIEADRHPLGTYNIP